MCLLVLFSPSRAMAGDLTGRITDPSGAAVPGAIVRAMNIASEQVIEVIADAEGRYTFAGLPAGTYRVVATAKGFADVSRPMVVPGEGRTALDLALEIGRMQAEPVNVTAMRGERDTAMVPLRVDRIGDDLLRQLAPASAGDVLVAAPGVTPVGSGPFQIRPRLRGLDSTRVLVLVDGQRLNNARTATDRAGIEVGLIGVDTIQGIEVLGGAGSVLYGTDALAGTINIMTAQPHVSATRQIGVGFDGFYSSNEDGRRGTVTLNVSDRRWGVRFSGGLERFENYRAGSAFGESSASLHATGVITRTDTIDTNFPGFNFRAFPDPFNAPFTRTGAEIARSQMEGSSINIAAVAQIRPAQELRLRYIRREATNIGFPDFEPPAFFQTITLPWSNLDKFSASYSLLNLTPQLRKLSVSTYLQRQDRLLRNEFPVQFPAPTAQTFFPINVFRLNITSETRQQVWTPGVEAQANFQLRADNVLTAGITWLRDGSEDERTTSTQTTRVGFVGMGPFGPSATVFATPVPQGPAVVEHPVRVPNASFTNTALFVQDEWDATDILRLSGGLRFDAYRVATRPTTGYDVQALVSSAVPAIDPATLPDVNGDTISRGAVTGETGAVLFGNRPVSLFAHYVHSYRHPNLEELLFSGPATAGNIVPNIQVEPETGHNVDVGARLRLGRVTSSVAYFVNRYRNFISTEVVANAPAGSISQAINLAAVRIHGFEAQAEAPFVTGNLAWFPHASVAVTRGTVLSGTSPMTGVSLAGAPQDNISPWKAIVGLRVADARERWWGLYGVRAQGEVTRISPLLSDSPFLIAQDLMALDGFVIHRLAGGYNWSVGRSRLGLTLAIENLTDEFYREQFQFAPARGRSVTLSISVR